MIRCRRKNLSLLKLVKGGMPGLFFRKTYTSFGLIRIRFACYISIGSYTRFGPHGPIYL